MQSSGYSSSAAPPQPSEYSFAVFPQPLVWSPPTVGWVYIFPRPLHLPHQRTWDSFLVNHLDVPWVNFVLGGKRLDLTFPPFPSWLLHWPWTLILVGFFLGLGLFPQPQVGVSLGSSMKGFTFGLGLVPQPIVASSPSSLGSLISWPWVITPFNLGITQLSSLSSYKLLSEGVTMEY